MRLWRCLPISKKEIQINEEIRDKELRIIGSDGQQLGIMSAKEALDLAEQKNLDLVKIAPQSNPPVCKIMDYGKYRFEQAKSEMGHPEIGLETMKRFADACSETAVVEKPAKLEGRNMLMFLAPKTNK